MIEHLVHENSWREAMLSRQMAKKGWKDPFLVNVPGSRELQEWRRSNLRYE